MQLWRRVYKIYDIILYTKCRKSFYILYISPTTLQ